MDSLEWRIDSRNLRGKLLRFIGRQATIAGHLFIRLGNNEPTWISAHMIDDMEALPEVESDFHSATALYEVPVSGDVIIDRVDVTFAAGVSINTKGTAFEESEPQTLEVGVDMAAPDSDKTALYLENAAMAREAKQGDYFPPAKDLPNQHVFSPQHDYLYTWVGSEKKVLEGVTFASVAENEPTVTAVLAQAETATVADYLKRSAENMERAYPGFMKVWKEKCSSIRVKDIDVDSLSIAMELAPNYDASAMSAKARMLEDEVNSLKISQRLNELSTINEALIMAGKEPLYRTTSTFATQGLNAAYFDMVSEMAKNALDKHCKEGAELNKHLDEFIERGGQWFDKDKPKRDKNGSRPKKKPRISFREGQYRCHFGNGKGIFALGVGSTYEEAYRDWKVKHDSVQDRAKVTRTAL
jgi:hypothetical protein